MCSFVYNSGKKKIELFSINVHFSYSADILGPHRMNPYAFGLVWLSDFFLHQHNICGFEGVLTNIGWIALRVNWHNFGDHLILSLLYSQFMTSFIHMHISREMWDA